MRTFRAMSLGLMFSALCALAAAGEHAGGSNKLEVVSIADAPDPFSPPVSGEVEIRAEFEARPTDAGAGAKANAKQFSVRVSVEIASEAGEIVRSLSEESAFSFPEHLPANQYHTVQCSTGWDGRDEAAEPVPDGIYTYAVRGALLRRDVVGSGKTQEHLVGRSGILTGTVTVDSTPPEKPTLPPGEEEVVWVLPGQEQVTLLVQVASDVVDVIVEAEEPLVILSVTMEGTLVEIVVDVTGLGSPVEARVFVFPVDSAGNAGEPFVFTIRMAPARWHVDVDATGANDGSSWADAFNLIQDAMDLAAGGQEIWVAEGTYTRRDPMDTVVLTMQDGVEIYGGFAGTESARDERDPGAHETTFDGEDIVYHVVVGASNAVLDGFTITGGSATAHDHADDRGGGMYNESVANLTVTNCVFIGNEARLDGGGMYNAFASLSVYNCRFEDNSLWYGGGAGMLNYEVAPLTVVGCHFVGNICNVGGGGGMAISLGSAQIEDCTFEGNWAFTDGGGILSGESSPYVGNCVFAGNTASMYDGGGIAVFYGSPTVADCAFLGNWGHFGGGVSSWRGSPALDNCVFSGNRSSLGGAVLTTYESATDFTNCTLSDNWTLVETAAIIFGYGGGSVTVTNCILWDEGFAGRELGDYDGTISFAVTHSNVQGGYAGAGNITENPLFVDADGADDIVGTLDDDLRLRLGSPCIDSADGDAAPEFDIEGNPRFDDPGTPDTGSGIVTYADMGAYELQDESIATDGVYDLELHPNFDDFEEGFERRILISAVWDGQPHTEAITTTNNETAQTFPPAGEKFSPCGWSDPRVVTVTLDISSETGVADLADNRVWFVATDPPDLSPYYGNPEGNDNLDVLDTPNAAGIAQGWLFNTTGESFAGHPSDYGRTEENEIAVDVTVQSATLATAEAVLRFTGLCSGDNYLVKAAIEDDEGVVHWDNAASILLVAWKRIYVEELRMYRVCSDLADIAASGSFRVAVENGSVFSDGDEVVVFDADNREGESAFIRSISYDDVNDWYVLELEDGDGNDRPLAANYDPGRGGAVAKPQGGYYDANLESDEVLKSYGGDSLGRDGGCFVEFVRLGDPKYVPLKENFGFYDELTWVEILTGFTGPWSENPHTFNCFLLCGACTGFADRPDALGMATIMSHGIMEAFVFQKTLEMKEEDSPERRGRITSHEFGHIFLDTAKHGNGGWDGRIGLMSVLADGSEFSHDQILHIRKMIDPYGPTNPP